MLSCNLETLKEVAFLTRDYHSQSYITTTVNHYCSCEESHDSFDKRRARAKSSQSLTALSASVSIVLFCIPTMCLLTLS